MNHPFRLLGAVLLALAVLVLAVPGADAGESRVPMPVLAKGKGEKCLEPNDQMRRYHMVYLKHQRDETMYNGVRGLKYSLKDCVDCHSVPAAPGEPPSLKAFCRQCHEYAAVHVDCFTCHSTKPQGSPAP